MRRTNSDNWISWDVRSGLAERIKKPGQGGNETHFLPFLGSSAVRAASGLRTSSRGRPTVGGFLLPPPASDSLFLLMASAHPA